MKMKSKFSFVISGIHLDEINVYETIPSNTLDVELQEYLHKSGVNSLFFLRDFFQ